MLICKSIKHQTKPNQTKAKSLGRLRQAWKPAKLKPASTRFWKPHQSKHDFRPLSILPILLPLGGPEIRRLLANLENSWKL